MKKGLKQPVEHYETMITWVEGRGNLHERPSEGEMFDSINENWHSEHCAYCKEQKARPSCLRCTLYKKQDGLTCGESTWSLIDDSETWAEWLTHAYKLLDVLREIEKEEAKRKEEEVAYEIGQRFLINNEKYILCFAGTTEATLVNLNSGCRYRSRNVEFQLTTRVPLNEILLDDITLIKED